MSGGSFSVSTREGRRSAFRTFKSSPNEIINYSVIGSLQNDSVLSLFAGSQAGTGSQQGDDECFFKDGHLEVTSTISAFRR